MEKFAIFVPTLGLVLPRFKEFAADVKKHFGVPLEPIATPFVAFSRQKIVALAAKRGYDRVIMIDDDVIFSMSAIDNMLESTLPIIHYTYPGKEDQEKIVAGNWRSKVHPLSVFPSKDLWLDRPHHNGLTLTKADWCGAGGMVIAKQYFNTAPLFSIEHPYNPWIKSQMYLGEDCTWCANMSKFAPFHFWNHYNSAYQDLILKDRVETDLELDSMLLNDSKFYIFHDPITVHMERISNFIEERTDDETQYDDQTTQLGRISS